MLPPPPAPVPMACVREIMIVELTVCYETNFKDAQLRKDKYMELVEEKGSYQHGSRVKRLSTMRVSSTLMPCWY